MVAVGAVAAAAVLFFTDDASAEVILEPASAEGDDPFMDSVATAEVDVEGGEVDQVAGGEGAVEEVEGLFGGTGEEATCDTAAMAAFLDDNPDEAEAFAEVARIGTDEIADYAEALTPVVLLEDTRVTNHGFSGGEATPFQSVLQAGTAVMVDDQGVPRVRCACGNPLLEPEPVNGTVEFAGDEWESFDPERLVAVSAGEQVDTFEVVDLNTGDTIELAAGRFEGGTPEGGTAEGGVTATIDVGDRPLGVAVGEGAVWVTSVGVAEDGRDAPGTVSRIDPATDTVTATIDDAVAATEGAGGSGEGLAVGEGAVWVTNSANGTVSRIDPATDTVAATIDVGARPVAIEVGDDAVWVTDLDDATVSRIDPATDTVAATIDVGPRPVGVGVGEGAVWVSHLNGTVSRIDPATDTVAATIDAGDHGVAVGEGAVWVTGLEDETVSRIDPATDTVTATIDVGGAARSVAVGQGAVWVSLEVEDTVVRIDPATDTVADTFDVGADPWHVAVGEDAVWVTNRDDGTVSRIG